MLDKKKKWFTEACTECGTALSFEIKEKLHQERTPFQEIEIYSTKNFGMLMVIDGFVMLTERDNFIYHEMLTHPALFSHPDPVSVVIAGGGDCGSLREVAKHSCVQDIVQVEIDERVTQLSKKYFPALCEANNDPRIKFIFDDAVQWLQAKQSSSVDIIIVDSTDPIGPGEGLYSTAFYKDCLRTLKPKGLLVQQSESPMVHLESIIQPMHDSMQAAGFSSTDLIYFPQPCYPTGWWSATVASKSKRLSFAREKSTRQSEIQTQYYNHAVHLACFATPQFMSKGLRSAD